MNYTISFYGKNFVLAGKKMKEAFESLIHKILNIEQYQEEITGIYEKPEEQSRWITMQVFGKVQTMTEEKKEELKQDINKILLYTPTKIGLEDLRKLSKEINQIFKKYIFVQDNRRHQAEEEKRQIEFREAEEKRQAERQEKEKSFEIYSPEVITRSENEMFITIAIYRDDSDIQTDYFHRHYSESDSYAIAKVPAGKRTEATARRIISGLEFLQGINFQWKVEEYSGGHGTYMESEPIGSLLHTKTYGGHENPPYWYEIHFNTYAKQMKKCKHYYEAQAEPEKFNGLESVEIRRNEEKNGIEIKFKEKPSFEILETLKRKGFRWSKFQKIWYSRFDSEKWNFANGLTQ